MTTISRAGNRQDGISPLAPAYYLGQPARVWFEAMRPRRSPTPLPATPPATTPARVNQSTCSTGLTQPPGAWGPSLDGHESDWWTHKSVHRRLERAYGRNDQTERHT
jgi:hypothetical protein